MHSALEIYISPLLFRHGVSKDLLSLRGAVLVFTIMDHDAIGADDFAGEVVLHLSSVPVIDPRQNVDDTPVVMLPVKRPGKTHETHEVNESLG